MHQVTPKNYTALVRWVAMLALLVLFVAMAVGETGISNYLQLRKNKEALEDSNTQLMVEIDALEEQLSQLNSSPYEQLRFLKEQYGYVEKGEVIYKFVKKKKTKVVEKHTRAQ